MEIIKPVKSFCGGEAGSLGLLGGAVFSKRVPTHQKHTTHLLGNQWEQMFKTMHNRASAYRVQQHAARRRHKTEIAPIRLLSPNGDETLYPGEKVFISWESDKEIDLVKLEYSPDNGSTY